MRTQTNTQAPATRHTGRPPVAPSAELAEEIRRLRTEERAKIERRRQEELARLRELARFD